jgi:hypothetical protein
VSGKVAPETVNPEPVMAAALTLRGALPAEVNVTVCVTAVFTGIVPKTKLDGLTLSVEEYATSCTVNV